MVGLFEQWETEQQKYPENRISTPPGVIWTRAVTVLDFFLPRWSSNKYRGLAVPAGMQPSISE